MKHFIYKQKFKKKKKKLMGRSVIINKRINYFLFFALYIIFLHSRTIFSILN